MKNSIRDRDPDFPDFSDFSGLSGPEETLETPVNERWRFTTEVPGSQPLWTLLPKAHV